MSLRSWTRIEPSARDDSLVEGLQARIADALWLLARQGALGEFTGEDAGSPVRVRAHALTSPLTRWHPAAADAAHDALAAPLERFVEEEGGAPGPLPSALAGMHYLRMAKAVSGSEDYRAGVIAAYPLPAAVPPPYAGRAPDGAALYAALSAGTVTVAPVSADAAALARVNDAWRRWYASTYDAADTPEAWVPERLEYQFSVAAPGPGGEIVLSASEYASGSLDWLDFDRGGATLVAGADPGTERVVEAIPTPVRYRGMPASRFWEFEDAAVDFGALKAPFESLTASLVVEFALTYANDHFLIPLRLPVGSLCRVDRLVVLDTFGVETEIRPVAEVDGPAGGFRLFEHSGDGRDALFCLFPTLGEVRDGPPIEEVHFLRDEAANLVWGVERTALGADGVPVDRTTPARQPQPHGTPGTLVYRLRTEVPPNWYPYLPEDGQLVLTPLEPLDGGEPAMPFGELLRGDLAREEVTRAGVRATRAWRHARWTDGRAQTWIGRRVGPGRGPGASGLRFDLALAPAEAPASDSP